MLLAAARLQPTGENPETSENVAGASRLQGEADRNPPPPGEAEYTIQRFSGDDGLPQDGVTCLTQTRDGYLWAGTDFGLARFDGVRFTVFDHFNTPALPGDAITALAEEAGGTLWIGTKRGLTRLERGRFADTNELRNLPDERITALLPAPEGGLWVGTVHGVARIQDGRITRYGEAAGLPVGEVPELHVLPEGRLLVRSVAGWRQFDPTVGRFLAVEERRLPQPDAWTVLPQDFQGLSWAADAGGVWGRLAGGWQRVLAYPAGARVTDVRFYDHAALGTLAQVTPLGVFRWNGSEMVPLAVNRPAWLERPRAALLDQEGSLWLATADGLLRLQRRAVQVTGRAEGLLSDWCLTAIPAADGTVWVGSAGGVNALRDGRVVAAWPLAAPEGEPGTVVLPTRDGRVWFSDGRETVFWRRADGSPEAPATALSVGPRRVRCLYEDRSGAVWVGTSAGLRRIVGSAFEPYPGGETLAVHDVRAVVQDEQGTLWVGTQGAGLMQLKDGRVTRVAAAAEAPGPDIRALCEGRQGRLWVGTPAGLHLWQAGRWRAFTRREGLVENLVNQILEDNEGRLWLSGVRGVHGVRVEELIAVTEGRAEQFGTLSLGPLDGLASAETSGGYQPAGGRDPLGRLWFPTPNGVVRVDPARVRANDRPPPVILEQVVADGRAMVPGEAPVRLHRREAGTVTVQFTAASFIQGDQVRFRYRLRGYDDDWREADGARQATYTNLRGGDYEFEVQAANAHGVWNPAPVKWRFSVAPYFHETAWFYLLCALAVAGATWGGVRLHQRRREAALRQAHKDAERQRARIAKDLHDDIGASLTGLALQADMASHQLDGKAKEELGEYAQRTRGLVERMREVVWAVNPECDPLDNFATYLTHYLENLPARGARVRIDIPADLPHHELRAEVRHQLLMVFKEALHNALEHSGATEVKVSLRLVDHTLRLTVADNGRGLAAVAAETADIGLSEMRERVEAIGGRIDIHSPAGEGTRVTVEVDLKAPQAEPAAATNGNP